MKILLLLLVFCLSASAIHAQSAATIHVFPQVADGRQIDGVSYTSRFWISNVSGFPATCAISLFGLGTGRLLSAPTATIPSGSWATVSTRGEDTISTGYARLDCSQAVFASLTIGLRSSLDDPLGMATVFSSPVSSFALIPVVLNGSYKYGIA